MSGYLATPSALRSHKPRRATAYLILAVALLGAWAPPRPARADLITIAHTGQAAPGGGTFGAHFGAP